ncbi:MAG: DUF4328 domain-containing protein [Mycobacteriaceae bacterium]
MPVQHCLRCRTEVPVRGLPLPWCPRCGGVLSAPVATTPWTTRWVAHPPAGTPTPRPVPPADPGPTPRYHGVPRWGLGTRVWEHPVAGAEGRLRAATASRAGALAVTARPLLVVTAVAAVAAAAAQGWRYGLLVRGRTELLSARTAALSDTAVITLGVLAPVLALVSAVVCTLWLVRARASAAEQGGVVETRSCRAVVAGVWLPLVNLGQAGVLVMELAHLLGDRAGASTVRVRGWWASWVACGVLSALSVAWRGWGTAQAHADAVVLTGLGELAGASCAVLTWVLVRTWTAELTGADRLPGRRWVPAAPERSA